MEDLKAMKQQLMAAAQGQMTNLEQVNAKELGEVIDMIKDLEEAIYYCSIVKAMDESKEEKKDNKKYDEIMTSLLARTGGKQEEEQRYYTQPYYPMWDDPREMSPYMIKDRKRLGYPIADGQSNGNPTQGGMGRDSREGRAGQTRRGYMESKETHQGKDKQMHELEDYMMDLTSDITEMIRGASEEEKMLLRDKLNNLVTKIANV